MKKKRVPKKRGRKLSLTRELLKRLCDLIRGTGCTLTDAAASVGISISTLHRWRSLGEDQASGIYRDLFDGVRKAEHEAKIMDLATVSKAAGAGAWQASKWRLEVKYPQQFAPRVLVHVREEQGEAIKRLVEAFSNVDEKLSAADALERACAAIAGEGTADQAARGEDGEGDSAGGAVGAAFAVPSSD